MPSVKDNSRIWGEVYDWSRGGDEWSEAWGGEDSQWFGVILPRIQAFITDADGLPRVHTIVEIAPGFGRWTKYLKGYCDRLIIIDLAEKCIHACRQRFASASHIQYYVNDGKSLAAAPDGAVDFLFSMDSLVHADEEAIDAYLSQIGKKLNAGGAAFIHHSNFGAFKAIHGSIQDHGRAVAMTADLFKSMAESHGLRCMSQELINWGGAHLIDAISVVARKDAPDTAAYHRYENTHFMAEAGFCQERSKLYGKHRLTR